MAIGDEQRRGPIVLVGGGKMGAALLAGWLREGVAAEDVLVVEPHAETGQALAARHKVKVVSDTPASFERQPSLILLAVKPQSLDAVAPAYKKFAKDGTCFLSIAAGKTLGYFEGHLGRDAAIVRAMPNTPAAVGRGMTVLIANGATSEEQMDFCETLLHAVGEVRWASEEAQFDAVTAVSGSGPAYVFLLIECLAQAGVEAGLPADLAMDLARATVTGSGELARQSEEDAGKLRQNVTSPGGTTAAALAVLMAGDGLQPLMTKAIAAAAKRSKELAG
ncbi:MAG TPA: pyrroline-5-carboxylate reductase [Alphaproteobacteria bacterium]|nr:pyrroline-5-carboxylate reductase [Alphaproteobacteria bacterium]